MVIWRGWGILSLVIGVLGGLLGVLLHGVMPARLAGALGLTLAAVVNFFVAQALNKPRREAYADNLHSLFWIPMEWWSVPMLVLALLGGAGFLGK